MARLISLNDDELILLRKKIQQHFFINNPHAQRVSLNSTPSNYDDLRWSKKYGHKIILILCYGNKKTNFRKKASSTSV